MHPMPMFDSNEPQVPGEPGEQQPGRLPSWGLVTD
jgi:hypothetical protein